MKKNNISLLETINEKNKKALEEIVTILSAEPSNIKNCIVIFESDRDTKYFSSGINVVYHLNDFTYGLGLIETASFYINTKQFQINDGGD